jgi:hypothetical protein
MTTAPPPSRAPLNRTVTNSPASKPAPRPVPTLSLQKPAYQPPRIVLNAVEGWGKTSFAANAPGVAILMGQGETGYTTLFNAGLVPAVPTANITSWADLLAFLDSFEPGDLKWLALDSLTTFERLCQEHVCANDFKGDWSEKGFASYGKGFEMSMGEWLKMLSRLDRIREQHGVGIILLAHTKVKTFKNPMGSDYDRYIADAHEKTWSQTAKWADCVLFGKFNTVVDGAKDLSKKGKGIGGNERIVYTEQRDAFDAKNRYGMPEEIDIPSDPAAAFPTIISYIVK